VGSDIDFGALAAAYEAEQPLYARLAAIVEEQVRSLTQGEGIKCTVTARTKDLTSVLGKAFRKRAQYSDPLSEINDKAGVRAVVTYESVVPRLRNLVRATFDVVKEEDKKEGLGDELLGYLGVHFELRVRVDSLVEEDQDLAGRVCELQIHSRAGNAWSEISHDLLYKAKRQPPPAISRRVTRLAAIVEVFDEEVSRARDEILSHPGMVEAQRLAVLEPHLYRRGVLNYDEELSVEVLGVLEPLLSPSERMDFIALVERFVEANDTKLFQLYEAYSVRSTGNPLIHQPEALLIFNRIESDPFAVAEAWETSLPLSLLENLATVWGRPLPSSFE
jgi:ppGpp synthetase/RelA/SpoT-type nucleotidyltranferase